MIEVPGSEHHFGVAAAPTSTSPAAAKTTLVTVVHVDGAAEPSVAILDRSRAPRAAAAPHGGVGVLDGGLGPGSDPLDDPGDDQEEGGQHHRVEQLQHDWNTSSMIGAPLVSTWGIQTHIHRILCGTHEGLSVNAKHEGASRSPARYTACRLLRHIPGQARKFTRARVPDGVRSIEREGP